MLLTKALSSGRVSRRMWNISVCRWTLSYSLVGGMVDGNPTKCVMHTHGSDFLIRHILSILPLVEDRRMNGMIQIRHAATTMTTMTTVSIPSRILMTILQSLLRTWIWRMRPNARKPRNHGEVVRGPLKDSLGLFRVRKVSNSRIQIL
jgi:hypothetical protein